MKKIVLTGGGTAGHVMPHLSLIPKLQKYYEVHYIGSKNGIEKDIIKNIHGVTYHEITCVKLVRSLTPKNLLIPFKLLQGITESKKLLKKIQPTIIFSKGGFVSVPVAFAGNKLNIPIISHESDITLGLANKLILKKCEVMCCSFEKTAKIIGKKGLYTGTPIRDTLFLGNSDIAMKKCGFTKRRTTLLFMGGSLGAKAINEVVVKTIPKLTKNYNVIHITGKNNLSGIKQNGFYEVEFVNDIEHYIKLADIVISRAGSNAINELLSLKKPMLLIPLPKGNSRGDQVLNAQDFESKNYCKILYQEHLNENTLLASIIDMEKSYTRYIQSMGTALHRDATTTILQLINTYEVKK